MPPDINKQYQKPVAQIASMVSDGMQWCYSTWFFAAFTETKEANYTKERLMYISIKFAISGLFCVRTLDCKAWYFGWFEFHTMFIKWILARWIIKECWVMPKMP